MLFLISYKFNDANAQKKGSKMLREWYDNGGLQNRPEDYDVQSWRELLEFTIEPCADLDQTVALYC